MATEPFYRRYREDPRPRLENLENLEIDPRCKLDSKYEKQFAEMWVTTFPDIDLYTQIRLCDDTTHRFDFFHWPSQTAIEIDGAAFAGRNRSSHNGGSNYRKDAIATYLGIAVIRITSTEIRDMYKSGDRQKLYLIAAIIERRQPYG